MVKAKRKLPETVRLALEEVKRELSRIYGERLTGIYLYGSYARGDFNENSDVDLIIALKGEVNSYEEMDRLSEVLSDICLCYDVLIATYPVPDEWVEKRESPLFKNVRREGVLL